jgi:hypothetical protein
MMVKPNGLHSIRFPFFFLLPCILFGAFAEFTGEIGEINWLSSTVLEGEAPEPGGTVPFVSENIRLYSQPLTKNRGQPGKLWKQIFSLLLFALLLKPLNKVTRGKYSFQHYFPRKFFHSLLISLILGGRAPPQTA